MIVAHALTEATIDDATTAIDLIRAVDGGLTSVTGDAAYDTASALARIDPLLLAKSDPVSKHDLKLRST